jgi:hypothetical protein
MFPLCYLCSCESKESSPGLYRSTTYISCTVLYEYIASPVKPQASDKRAYGTTKRT